MDIRAKSEARRRKLLENKESRMKQILSNAGTPKEFTESSESLIVKNESPQMTESDHTSQLESPLTDSISREVPSFNENNSDVPGSKDNDRVADNCAHLEAEVPLRGHSNCSNEIPKDVSNPAPSGGYALSTPFSNRRSVWDRLFISHKAKHSACFVLLALAVRILYCFHLSWVFGGTILTPFLIFVLPLLVFLPENLERPSGFIHSAVVMAGVPPAVYFKLFKIHFVVRYTLQMWSIYLVTFVVTHVSYSLVFG